MFQFAPDDRGIFQINEHRRQAIKEQIIRLKTKKIEDDFYKWNKDFLGLSECLGIKAYVSGKKQYPLTQEILCDTLADGDEGKYISDVVAWFHKDAFGRSFLTWHKYYGDFTSCRVFSTRRFLLTCKILLAWSIRQR